MINLTNFKITKFTYPYTNEEFEELIWVKMNEQEIRWAVKLGVNGINDSGENENSSWDTFFLENRLQDKIEELLDKYEISYIIEDRTKLLSESPESFSNEFLEKLLDYLSQNLSVDGVLDNIIEVGIHNLTVFEKYFLDNSVEIKKKID